MFSKRSQPQKSTYYIIPIVWILRTGKINLEVRIVVTFGRRGMGINRRGGRGILGWWEWSVSWSGGGFTFIGIQKNVSSYIIFYSMLYLKKNWLQRIMKDSGSALSPK